MRAKRLPVTYAVLLGLLLVTEVAACGSASHKRFWTEDRLARFAFSIEYRDPVQLAVTLWNLPKKPLARFSFEYPTRYRVVDYEPHSQYDILEVSLKGPPPQDIDDVTVIGVAVSIPDKNGPPNSDALIDRKLSYIRRFSDEIVLLGESTATVAGIRARRIDYRQRNILPIFNRKRQGPLFWVFREVRFDYGGRIWSARITSDESTAEADKADFEHVLKTFKILE